MIDQFSHGYEYRLVAITINSPMLDNVSRSDAADRSGLHSTWERHWTDQRWRRLGWRWWRHFRWSDRFGAAWDGDTGNRDPGWGPRLSRSLDVFYPWFSWRCSSRWRSTWPSRQPCHVTRYELGLLQRICDYVRGNTQCSCKVGWQFKKVKLIKITCP